MKNWLFHYILSHNSFFVVIHFLLRFYHLNNNEYFMISSL